MAVSRRTKGGAETAGYGATGVGFWLWVLQRVSAVLLFLLLGAHIWLSHFSSLGISYKEVSDRLNRPYFLIIDLLLLILIIFHALNGTRAVVIDLGIGERAQVLLSWTLLAVGIIALFLGVNFLLPFISGKALF